MSAVVWGWIIFVIFVIIMLLIDLGIFHRHAHVLSIREATVWSIVWILIALLINSVVWVWQGTTKALEFFTGYLVEKALSADNIFVFAVIFNYFGVPPQYRHRVLFWGILGAIVMRMSFILAGAALLKKFHWVVYLFGIIVILSGIKLLRRGEHEYDPKRNPILRIVRRFLPVTPSYLGQTFFTRQNGQIMMTPLAISLFAIETSDIVFAIDSIPAIFAITRDPFIVFTSNICAILGLRALYFLLEGLIRLFRYLDEGLAVILMFIGTKMLLSEFYKIPIGMALGFVFFILSVSIGLSAWIGRKEGIKYRSLGEEFGEGSGG